MVSMFQPPWVAAAQPFNPANFLPPSPSQVIAGVNAIIDTGQAAVAQVVAAIPDPMAVVRILNPQTGGSDVVQGVVGAGGFDRFAQSVAAHFRSIDDTLARLQIGQAYANQGPAQPLAGGPAQPVYVVNGQGGGGGGGLGGIDPLTLILLTGGLGGTTGTSTLTSNPLLLIALLGGLGGNGGGGFGGNALLPLLLLGGI